MKNCAGSNVLAIQGMNCVVIGTDNAVDGSLFRVAAVRGRLYCGIEGPESHVKAVRKEMAIRVQRISGQVTPEVYTMILSRFLQVSPVPYQVDCIVAGLQPVTRRPYIATVDMLGITNYIDDFVAVGKLRPQLHVNCEALYKRDMSVDDVLETMGNTLFGNTNPDVVKEALIFIIRPSLNLQDTGTTANLEN
ncbi:proteasome subunit beta type-3-like [Drosophila guanche]|uniref:proteasome subunit beta type-3-like n=1 Tax=Drosophila guanche TaxID=7266 RepID=UPI00147088C0|nr:proteasome subunit beta type-3-like [Drosophila guanche]